MLLFVALSSRPLGAQEAHSWQRVQNLQPGTSIVISSNGEKVRCSFDSADEHGLTCHRRRAGVDRTVALDRSTIRSVRKRNLVESSAVGAVLGAGVGAGVGALVDSRINDPKTTDNAKFTGGLGRAGALLGGFFGLATDFVPGKLVYKRTEAQ